MDPADAVLWVRGYLHEHPGSADAVDDGEDYGAGDGGESDEGEAVSWMGVLD